jgi:hypothetical protein
MEHIVNTNVEQEFAGIPLTHEVLREEGFLFKAEELSQEELNAHSDPFYYYKGEFRVYDVAGDFYVKPPGRESGTGTRIQTLEALQEAYIDFMGRTYTKYAVVEDTPPPDYEALPAKSYDAKLIGQIKLVGGPGDGVLTIWPKAASFFIYQTTKVVGGRVMSEGWEYKRKEDDKTVFEYIGPTPD